MELLVSIQLIAPTKRDSVVLENSNSMIKVSIQLIAPTKRDLKDIVFSPLFFYVSIQLIAPTKRDSKIRHHWRSNQSAGFHSINCPYKEGLKDLFCISSTGNMMVSIQLIAPTKRDHCDHE